MKYIVKNNGRKFIVDADSHKDAAKKVRDGLLKDADSSAKALEEEYNYVGKTHDDLFNVYDIEYLNPKSVVEHWKTYAKTEEEAVKNFEDKFKRMGLAKTSILNIKQTNNIQDSKEITVNLEGKNYKAVYRGVSSNYPDMADVYIPELAVFNSKPTPADDLGNHPKDGKYYIKKDRIKDAEELPHISKEQWNKIPKDYKTTDPATGKKQAFAGSLGIAPGGTTLLTEGKHFIIDADIEDVKELVKDIMKNDHIRISRYSSNGEITIDSDQLYSADVEELARVIRQRGHKCDILNTRTVKLRDVNSLKDAENEKNYSYIMYGTTGNYRLDNLTKDEAEKLLKNNKLLGYDGKIGETKTLKDAKQAYVINYKDTYEGRQDKETIYANSLKEAVKEFAKIVAVRGQGTANINVLSISPNDGYVTNYGKLSELVKVVELYDAKTYKSGEQVKAKLPSGHIETFTVNKDLGNEIEVLEITNSGNKLKYKLNKSQIIDSAIKDALNGKLSDLNAKEFVEKALTQGSIYTERSDRRGETDYIITVDPQQRNNTIYIDIVKEGPDENYDADDRRYYNRKQERILSKRVNTKEEAIKVIEDFKRSVRDNAIKDIDGRLLTQSAKELKEELGLARKVIGSHLSKGIKEYKPRQNQFNNKDVAEVNEAINDAIRYIDQGFGEESYRRLEIDLDRIKNTMPNDTSSEEYKVLNKVLNKGTKALNAMKQYLNSNKDSNTVRDSIKEGETYTNKNGVQVKILGINTDVTGKKYATYRIKNDTYNHPVENVENMLKANYYTKDSNTVEDDIDTQQYFTDARRLNYDDDIIKVYLNGKEVFKGYAEDWIDDDFYKNFKWTGSQYEATNAKGKWVVKVVDSAIKDSNINDAVTKVENVGKFTLWKDEEGNYYLDATISRSGKRLQNLKTKDINEARRIAKEQLEFIEDESIKDGGFQEIGGYWRDLERKNPGISKIYEEFRKTPTFNNWDMKNSMDIIYSEEMFNKFEQFYKQKTGKLIKDSAIKDSDIEDALPIEKTQVWNPDYYLKKEPNYEAVKDAIRKTLKNSGLTPTAVVLSTFNSYVDYTPVDMKLDPNEMKNVLDKLLKSINSNLYAAKVKCSGGTFKFTIEGFEYLLDKYKVFKDSAIKDAYYNIGGYKSKDDKMLKQDISKAKLYGLKTYVEEVDGSYQLTVEGSYDKVKKIVEDYFAGDVSSIGDKSVFSEETMNSVQEGIEKDYESMNNRLEELHDGSGDAYDGNIGDKVKDKITGEIWTIVKHYQMGNYAYVQIERNGIIRKLKMFADKGSPQDVYRYALMDSAVIKDASAYGITPLFKWKRGNKKPERVEHSLESARYVKNSLERNDGIPYVIFELDTYKIVDSIHDDRLSPMTYSKLKELGYDHEDWKDLTQEQANELVAKGRKENTEQGNSEEKETAAETKPAESKKEEKSEEVETTAWKDIEEDDIVPINGQYYHILSKGKNSIRAREYPDGDFTETLYKEDIEKFNSEENNLTASKEENTEENTQEYVVPEEFDAREWVDTEDYTEYMTDQYNLKELPATEYGIEYKGKITNSQFNEIKDYFEGEGLDVIRTKNGVLLSQGADYVDDPEEFEEYKKHREEWLSQK